MGNEVRIVSGRSDQAEGNADFVRVCTSSDPADDTVTLATIQRFVARPAKKDSPWRIKTLILEQPMSLAAALGLATCYAKRKNISVVYTDGDSGE
jgi:hypothetical protein